MAAEKKSKSTQNKIMIKDLDCSNDELNNDNELKISKNGKFSLKDLDITPSKKNKKTTTMKDIGMRLAKKDNNNEFNKMLNFKQYINKAIDDYIEEFDPKSKETEKLGKILNSTISYNMRMQKTYNNS